MVNCRLCWSCFFPCLTSSDSTECAADTAMLKPQAQNVSLGKSAQLKVPLQKGYSLMDWVRFSGTSKDLSGTKGKVIKVTEAMMAQHSTREDGWTIINDKVYNISPYMKYHPGGENQLLRAVGIDGTDLFNEYHPWVNYESLLKNCCVGIFAGSKLKFKNVVNHYSHSNYVFLVRNPPASLKLPSLKDEQSGDLTPRIKAISSFDFESTLTLGVNCADQSFIAVEVVTVQDKYELFVYVKCDKVDGSLWCKLKGPVDNVSAVFVNSSTIKITLKKSFDGPLLDEKDPAFLRFDKPLQKLAKKCEIATKTSLTHNTDHYQLRLPPLSIAFVPCGYHCYINAVVDDYEISRPYTPILSDLNSSIELNVFSDTLDFMIKHYEDGALTSQLRPMKMGDSVNVSSTEGSFSYDIFTNKHTVFMLAAGTGITPMMKTVLKALSLPHVMKIDLFFFNRKECDIVWRETFDQLATDSKNRFSITHILSEPSKDWTGANGRVSVELLSENKILPDNNGLVLICGPIPFSNTAVSILTELKWLVKNVHCFKG